jgi:hypothetical protein
LLHGQSWNAGVGQAALFGAATSGIAMVGAKLVSKGMRWVARKLLQSVTNAQSAALAGDRTLAAGYLSRRQYANLMTGPRWLARMRYGTAMESMVAARVERSPLRFLYRHLGNALPFQRVPDFVGTGPFSGMNFDVTTPEEVARHLAHPTYGQGLIIVTYHRYF